MKRLVTVEEAMKHLRYETQPPELELLIDAASAAVRNYLGANASFLDVNGHVIDEIPFEVKAATLIWLGEMDKNREGEQEARVDSKFGYGFPPPAVISLLCPLRDPRMA